MMKAKIVKLNIDVICNEMLSSSILDVNSKDFEEFEESVLSTFAMNGYEFKECHRSNTENSESMYYTFVKLVEQVKVKVMILLRISDHVAPSRITSDGRRLSAKYLRNRYVKKLNDSDDDNIKMSKSIEIIFDDRRFTTYDSALLALAVKLQNIESAIKEGRK